jgi:hypothetical protein
MPNLLTLLLLVFAGVNYFGLFTDLDWTWQVRTGREILRTGTLSPPDAFTYTLAGQTLPDFEWLYEVVLAVVFDALGIGGLKLLRVLLVGTPLMLLARHLARAGAPRSACVLSVLAAMVLLAPFWNLRPLFVTTTGLLFVAGWLDDCVQGRPTRAWTLPLGMLLWSNMHPGVLAGMALLAGAMVWEWANLTLRWNRPMRNERLWRLTWVGSLGLAAAMACPDPFGRIRYALDPNLRHPVMRYFTEMQPMHEAVWNHPWPLVAIYVLAALLIVALLRAGRAVRGWQWGLALGVTLLAHVAVRAVPDFLLVLLLLAVPHWKGRAAPLETDAFALQRSWLAGILSALTVVSLIPPLARRMPLQDASHWPVRAADFAERTELRGNVFASPLFGTYLAWRRPDDVKVYADTRGFFFPPAVLEDSYEIPMCFGAWRTRLERILSEGRTDYFLLETTGPFGAFHRRLAATVVPIHHDDLAALYTAAQVRRALFE